jgi:hypothetical protein
MTPPLRRASSAPARLGRNNRAMSPAAINRLALMLANMSLHASPMNVNNPRKRRRSPTVRRSPGGNRKRTRR